MTKKAPETIDAYIPAAALMVIARDKTETMYQAVEWVKANTQIEYEDGYLRLLWLGANAKATVDELKLKPTEHQNALANAIHPDYEEYPPAVMYALQSPDFAVQAAKMISESNFIGVDVAWLGTFKSPTGQRVQLQLVAVSDPDCFVDEE